MPLLPAPVHVPAVPAWQQALSPAPPPVLGPDQALLHVVLPAAPHTPALMQGEVGRQAGWVGRGAADGSCASTWGHAWSRFQQRLAWGSGPPISRTSSAGDAVSRGRGLPPVRDAMMACSSAAASRDALPVACTLSPAAVASPQGDRACVGGCGSGGARYGCFGVDVCAERQHRCAKAVSRG